MKIGNINIDNPLILAPMAGITDTAFRVICRMFGCGLVYTEMASAKGMFYNDAKSFEIIRVVGQSPIALQLFGSEPEIMERVVVKLCDGSHGDFDLIDINMGCPVPKIVKNNEGSALMQNPKLAQDIIKAVVRASDRPVTVKIRKGWDDNSINAVEFSKMLEQSGISAICVHGRTRMQFYSGKADWDIIGRVKNSVSVPVIGNGDIFSPEDASNMIKHTGCDAVAIARGARGNPWLFSRSSYYISKGIVPPEPTLSEKIEVIKKHLKLEVELKGKHTGVNEMRKHIAWYVKGIKGSASFKDKVFRMTDEKEIEEALDKFLCTAGCEE